MNILKHESTYSLAEHIVLIVTRPNLSNWLCLIRNHFNTPKPQHTRVYVSGQLHHTSIRTQHTTAFLAHVSDNSSSSSRLFAERLGVWIRTCAWGGVRLWMEAHECHDGFVCQMYVLVANREFIITFRRAVGEEHKRLLFAYCPYWTWWANKCRNNKCNAVYTSEESVTYSEVRLTYQICMLRLINYLFGNTKRVRKNELIDMNNIIINISKLDWLIWTI